MVHSSHYEVNSLNYSIDREDSPHLIGHSPQSEADDCSGLPSTSYAQEQRARYLMRLIQESYLLVDLSECLEELGSSAGSYERCVKHELVGQD